MQDLENQAYITGTAGVSANPAGFAQAVVCY
jgi:hypothetical protein